MNEIERCTNIQQRDQYRLLIAQYRDKSLAETENIFCKQDLPAKGKPLHSRFENHAPAFIDLSKTPSPVKGKPV